VTATSHQDLPSLPPMYFDPQTPVSFDERIASWQVFSHHDVARVLNDPALFSSDYGTAEEDPQRINPLLVGMWATDGPRHTDLRSAAAEPFRPRILDNLATDIREIVTGLLDRVVTAGNGRVEVVGALAKPMPGQVVCRVLGLDVSHADQMMRWLDEIAEVSVSTNTYPPRPDMVEFFQDLIDDRRKHPQVGLVDDLIAAQAAGYQVDGRTLRDWDLVGYFSMMLAAGSETTTAGVGNAVLLLTEYGHWDELGADPSLIPGAVEETLRWSPPFSGPRRLVLADTEVGGQQIKAGQWITAWVSAANRDPERFPSPDTFDVRRRPNPELSFGVGTHHCLGAPLARLEIRILLEEAVRRLPGLSRDVGAPISRREWIVNGLTEAHFTFDTQAPDTRH
jgi:cytochrome P450